MKTTLKSHALPNGAGVKRQARLWTKEEEDRLAALYPNTPTVDLSLLFSRTVRGIQQRAVKLKLKRSREQVAFNRFKQGNEPWNKGKKFNAGGRSSQTHFKKGHTPKSSRPVGSRRTTKDGYIERKVSEPNRWKLEHVFLWERENGSIPQSHCVIFKDGNKANLAIENLQLISRKELMARNTIHRYPEELKSSMRLLSKLKRTIKEKQVEQ